MTELPDQLHVRPAQSEALLERLEKAAAKVIQMMKAMRPVDPRRPQTMSDLWEALSLQTEEVAGLTHEVREVAGEWKERARKAVLTLESDFREACAAHGWQVDGEWPVLYVARAVKVDIDERRGLAVIGGSRSKNLDTPSLTLALADLVPHLLPKSHSAETFLSQIEDSYRHIAGSSSSQVPIWTLYEQLVVRQQHPKFWRDARSGGFRELTADQFRARFTDLLSNGPVISKDGRVLRLLPPVDPKDAMFIYQPGEARFGYVGRVEFVSEARAW